MVLVLIMRKCNIMTSKNIENIILLFLFILILFSFPIRTKASECKKITNEYKNVEIDYKKQSETKIKLQNMQNCEDWYPQYQFLTEQQFRLQKNVESTSDCIMLYNDSVWQYIGEDRLEKLHNRLDEIKSELPQSHETRYLTLDVDISDSEPKTIDAQKGADKAADLEEKIRSLEEELSKKDEIIREQLKVIMDLANRIKNVMFGTIDSFLMQIG